ncbi:hypothetical protein [Jatrophihabitans fulvus]
MPITVVTHRDDVGAPTSRDVLAAADRYVIKNSALEVLAEGRIVAHYPSGNWLSVFVDEPVRVLSTSPLGKDATSWVEVDPGLNVHLDFLDGHMGADAFRVADRGSAPTSHTSAASPASAASPTSAASAASAASPGVAAPTAAPASPPPWADMRPSTGPVYDPEADQRRPSVADVPADKDAFMPVAFAPRPLRPPEESQDEQPPRERMQQLRFRPRIFRAAHGDGTTPAADPPSDRPRMQRIAFRPRVYRAAQQPPQPAPEPDDADEPSE